MVQPGELLVPKESGGAGLGFGDYWRVLAELGAYNGAAALGFNMHHVVIGALADSVGTRLSPAADTFRAWMLDEVVHGRNRSPPPPRRPAGAPNSAVCRPATDSPTTARTTF